MILKFYSNFCNRIILLIGVIGTEVLSSSPGFPNESSGPDLETRRICTNVKINHRKAVLRYNWKIQGLAQYFLTLQEFKAKPPYDIQALNVDFDTPLLPGKWDFDIIPQSYGVWQISAVYKSGSQIQRSLENVYLRVGITLTYAGESMELTSQISGTPIQIENKVGKSGFGTIGPEDLSNQATASPGYSYGYEFVWTFSDQLERLINYSGRNNVEDNPEYDLVTFEVSAKVIMYKDEPFTVSNVQNCTTNGEL